MTRRHYYYTKWQHKKTEEKKKTIHEASCERLSYSSPTPPPLLVLPPDVSSQDKLRRNGKLCHTIFAPESKLTMLSTDFYRRTHARPPLIEHGQRHQPWRTTNNVIRLRNGMERALVSGSFRLPMNCRWQRTAEEHPSVVQSTDGSLSTRRGRGRMNCKATTITRRMSCSADDLCHSTYIHTLQCKFAFGLMKFLRHSPANIGMHKWSPTHPVHSKLFAGHTGSGCGCDMRLCACGKYDIMVAYRVLLCFLRPRTAKSVCSSTLQ